MYGWNHGFWFGGFGMILLWIVIIAGAVWLIRTLLGKNGERSDNGPHPDSPLDMLKRRYAAGDITKEEFEQKKHDIMSSP